MAKTYASADIRSKTAEACSTGDLPTLEALLPKDAPKSQRTPDILESLLNIAVRSKHANIVRYLLDLDPNAEIPSSVVYEAACIASIEIYGLLLQKQPEILQYGWERVGDSVMVSVLSKDLAFLTFLLENGADPGRDPRHYDWRHHTRSLPVELAVLRSQKDVIQTLLDHGARLHPTEALQWAAGSGKLEILELLLKNGANINAMLDEDLRDNYMSETFGSALHNAVENKQVETVKFLLDRGANAALLDSEGRSALVMAEILGDGSMISLLRQQS